MKTFPQPRGFRSPTPRPLTTHSQALAPGLTDEQAAIPTAETPIDRGQRIAETAYYIAMQRGFTNGDPMQDWLEAERQIGSNVTHDKR